MNVFESIRLGINNFRRQSESSNTWIILLDFIRVYYSQNLLKSS